MIKLSCEIVQDLLPLYHDEVCNSETKASIEAHLANCEHCKAALQKLQQNSSLPFEVIRENKQESAALASFKGYWKRSKAVSFVKGLLVATAVCSVLVLGYYGLFRWNSTEVPSSVIKITDVSLMKDGRIAYHVTMTDGYRVNQISGRMGDDGILYMTPKRPVIKSKADAERGLANGYTAINLEQFNTNRSSSAPKVKAIYYGAKKDNPILLWEQGMELPPSSAAVEAQLKMGTKELPPNPPGK